MERPKFGDTVVKCMIIGNFGRRLGNNCALYFIYLSDTVKSNMKRNQALNIAEDSDKHKVT